MIRLSIQILVLVLILASCKSKTERKADPVPDIDSVEMEKLEAREDSLEMVMALEAQSEIKLKLTADVETEPVGSAQEEDAADDPAIWHNDADPSRSLILGTDKNAGIYVYDLEGKVVQFRDVGRINNVDLRDGFFYDNKEVVLVAGSNRSINCITLFYLDKETGILSDSLMNIPSGVDEVYGICLHKNRSFGEMHVFVNGKGGMFEQWNITAPNGVFKAELLRRFTLNSQPEGMVADDRNGIVYLGVEEEGIYKLDTDPDGDTLMILLQDSDSSNPYITYDVEGLALFSYNNENYLLASIQGSFSYAIFKLEEPDRYLTSFTIVDDLIDGVEETDGLEISTQSFNDQFKDGMLVVQDGFNTSGELARSQNFKYVSFSKISEILENQ